MTVLHLLLPPPSLLHPNVNQPTKIQPAPSLSPLQNSTHQDSTHQEHPSMPTSILPRPPQNDAARRNLPLQPQHQNAPAKPKTSNLSGTFFTNHHLPFTFPSFLGNFQTLDTLDLSSNRFSRLVPKSFANLTKIFNRWIVQGTESRKELKRCRRGQARISGDPICLEQSLGCSGRI